MEKTKILHFFLFCIYALAEKYGKTSAYIFDIFEKYGVSPYIIDCYDALHTQGKYYIIDDLEGFVIDKGGDFNAN
ncbi:MAG: DUF3791 domain-containing protein [Oscillospiraceae bacterium]|nr:DUF3791 domain-containing protein [Oscillospiraceae bacterium]